MTAADRRARGLPGGRRTVARGQADGDAGRADAAGRRPAGGGATRAGGHQAAPLALDRRELAQLSSLVTEAIARQPGREADFADAALTAAARWDGISAPDTLHNTFNAARAYQRLGRHGDAAALFAQAIPEVDVPYDTRTVAMTREQYGRSLTAIGRHREAAEQFLEAARLIADDQENSAAHANVAAARGRGAATVRPAGRGASGVPAGGGAVRRARRHGAAGALPAVRRLARLRAGAGPAVGGRTSPGVRHALRPGRTRSRDRGGRPRGSHGRTRGHREATRRNAGRA